MRWRPTGRPSRPSWSSPRGPSSRSACPTIPTGESTFDLVLANLVASMIVELALGLTDELRPGGGRLVTGGVFADREAEVRRALNAAGLHVLAREEEEEWVAIEAERP